MASYNRIIIMGNLTRDPEYKQLTSGQSVCRLGLASNRQFKNRQTGQAVQEVCFIDVDVWGAQAESCHQFLQKGRSVLVEGRLKLDTWEDNGQKRSKHSIVADAVKFLGGQNEDESKTTEDNYDEEPKKAAPAVKAAKPAAPKVASQKQTTVANPSGEIAFKDQQPFDDDLPF
jgi:single-strand DNA-binding protein